MFVFIWGSRALISGDKKMREVLACLLILALVPAITFAGHTRANLRLVLLGATVHRLHRFN